MEAIAIGVQGLVAGLLFMGLAPQRLAKAKAELAQNPWRSLGLGFVGLIGALAAIIAACVTLIGIPIGVLLALALPLVAIVGIGVSVSVLGAILPIEAIRDQPLKQTVAGAASLAAIALVPVLGALVGACAALAGIGALLGSQRRPYFQRFRKAGEHGPYRTASPSP